MDDVLRDAPPARLPDPILRALKPAASIEVRSADLGNGLLSIDLVRHEPERLVRTIAIGGGTKV